MNKERILALPGVFLPHNETITQIAYKILCNLDYEIDILVFKAQKDKYFVDYLKKDSKFKKMHIHYIDIDWKELNINSNNFNIFKIKKYINLYIKESINLAKSNKYKAVFSFSMPNYTHMAAYMIKKMYKDNIKWYASFSDPISNNLYIEQFKKEKFKTKILYVLLKITHYRKKYEKVSLNYADKLIFICKELRDYITNKKEKYVSKSIIYPITYIKDWINFQKLTSSAKEKNDNDKIVFAHFGNIYGLRKIDKFLKALNELKSENKEIVKKIEIHQYGDVDKCQLANYNSYDLKSILHFHNRVDYDECIDIMSKSDVLLIFDTIVEKNGIQPFLPSKITDYLLTNKPIFAITLQNSPLYDIINKEHICVNNDSDEIKKALTKQILNYKNISNDIQKYDNDYVSKKIFETEFKMINTGKGDK